MWRSVRDVFTLMFGDVTTKFQDWGSFHTWTRTVFTDRDHVGSHDCRQCSVSKLKEEVRTSWTVSNFLFLSPKPHVCPALQDGSC